MKRISIVALVLVVLTVLSVLPASAFGTGTVIGGDYEASREVAERPAEDQRPTEERPTTSREDASASSDFESGDGTQSDPFIIKTEEQLEKAVSGYYMHSWFKLGTDIKIKKDNWKTEGVFVGTLDGDGHVISGLKSNYGGLFEALSGARVRNLGLVNVDISVKSNNVYVGALARTAYSSQIENCYVTGSITVEGNCNAAAFLGRAAGNSVVSDCLNKATVEAKSAAGIVGTLEESTVFKSVNLGTVKGSDNAKAIAAEETNGSVAQCYYLEGSVKVGEATWDGVGEGMTSVTSDSMKKQETFKGLDFENVWKLSESGISLTIEKSVSDEDEEKDEDEENDKKSKNGNWIMIAIIIGGSLVVAIVAVVIISVAVSKKKKSKKAKEKAAELENQPTSTAQPQSSVQSQFQSASQFASASQFRPQPQNIVQPEPVSEPEIEEEIVEETVSKPEIAAAPFAQPEPEVVEEPEAEEETEVEEAEEETVEESVVEEAVAEPKSTVDEVTEPVFPKFCFKCGSPVVEGANFCNSCGNKLR